ncbi:flagellar hook-basal body complex protein [Clostridium estertheticum]|uniref:flagellar hook-basal body complex protein n=1 Tax=Clostridium estertheticum TaxID=238834 RepID=UPI001CF12A12|nr:flagellar hook-basal body complex protein [Clostridium estertheticum]MCB2356677.1 flagellar hook-basal body complex protein [Clostridium estertheticum]WAG42794.1 flagellar hook-basal body complex protein [Clostridium estertheticum]
MLRSLYAGISGMKVNQQKLDIIANNIANVGTTAFKSSRVRFQDMVSQSMTDPSSSSTNTGGVNGKQIGLGVQVAGIDTMVGQGMMQPTSRNLDVAMDGEGYLMVGKGPVPDANATAVTLLDKKNTIVDTNKMEISYTRDGALTLDDKGNLLNSDGLRVLGYAVSDGTQSSLKYTGGVPTSNYVNGNGTLTADKTALIPLVIPESIDVSGTADKIKTFSIEKDGTIKAVLNSGKVSVLGQIAMASFKNPAGLKKVGGNLLKNTSNSGDAVVRSGIGTAPADDNSGSYGDMLSGMLEMSNVDLAEQFTDMIVASRAFQAMGKTITTGDEILQDIIGLKR